MASFIKHTPKSIDQVILPPSLALMLAKMAEIDQIEPMLFYGPPGCGKSLTASLISENIEVFRCDGRYSGSDLIDRIWKCVTSRSLFHLDTRRLIVLDEIDKFNTPSQERVRAIIDEGGKSASFIATTNHLDCVLPALRSRMLPINFGIDRGNHSMISKWKERLIEIYLSENGKQPDAEIIENAIRAFPDARRMISATITGYII